MATLTADPRALSAQATALAAHPRPDDEAGLAGHGTLRLQGTNRSCGIGVVPDQPPPAVHHGVDRAYPFRERIHPVEERHDRRLEGNGDAHAPYAERPHRRDEPLRITGFEGTIDRVDPGRRKRRVVDGRAEGMTHRVSRNPVEQGVLINFHGSTPPTRLLISSRGICPGADPSHPFERGECQVSSHPVAVKPAHPCPADPWRMPRSALPGRGPPV